MKDGWSHTCSGMLLSITVHAVSALQLVLRTDYLSTDVIKDITSF